MPRMVLGAIAAPTGADAMSAAGAGANAGARASKMSAQQTTVLLNYGGDNALLS